MVARVDVRSLVLRLQTARAQLDDAIVATDADGTLWKGDVGIDAFSALVEQRRIRPQALPALHATAITAGLEVEGDANDIAASIYRACQRGAFGEAATYEMMAWAFAGMTVGEVRAFADGVQCATALATRLHPEMKAITQWVVSHGLKLYVVSASPVWVVQQGIRLLGLDPGCVIAATASVRHDTVQPELAEPLPYGTGKVDALHRRVPGARVLAAFGDNVFDIDMLKLGHVAVAVRPTQRLVERWSEVQGLVVLDHDDPDS